MSNIVDETSFNQEDTLLIDVKAYLKPMLRLTPEAQEATENWIVYKTLSQNIRNRDTIRIGKLKTNIAAMKTVFVTQNEAQDAQVSVIPSQLELPSIQARTLAVETQVKVLINLLEKKQLEICFSILIVPNFLSTHNFHLISLKFNIYFMQLTCIIRYLQLQFFSSPVILRYSL